MTFQDIIDRAVTIYDEYSPEVNIDTDIETFLESFFNTHLNDFMRILPYNKLQPFVKTADIESATDIDYGGGYVTAPDDMEKLVSIKLSTWQRTLTQEDVIEATDPTRKKQESKFTCGKSSRPVVCIEIIDGKKCISFWSTGTGTYTYLATQEIPSEDNVEKKESEDEADYKKRILNLQETYFKTWSDTLINAWIYYALSYAFVTQEENTLSQLSMAMCQQLLATEQITPTQPVQLAENTKKK